MGISDHLSVARRIGGALLPELLLNVALPYIIYSWAAPHMGDAKALLLAFGPPIVWGLGELMLRSRVDAISLLSVAGIGLSLLVLVGGGSARFLQLREKLATGAIGIVLLGSCLIGQPLLLKLAEAGARRGHGERAERLRMMMDQPGFQRQMTILTLVWAVGLLLDVAVSAALVFALPIRTYLLVNPVLGYATMGGLSLWTFVYARQHGLNGARARSLIDHEEPVGQRA